MPEQECACAGPSAFDGWTYAGADADPPWLSSREAKELLDTALECMLELQQRRLNSEVALAAGKGDAPAAAPPAAAPAARPAQARPEPKAPGLVGPMPPMPPSKNMCVHDKRLLNYRNQHGRGQRCEACGAKWFQRLTGETVFTDAAVDES